MFFAAGTSTLAGVTALLSSVPAAFSTFSPSDAAGLRASSSLFSLFSLFSLSSLSSASSPFGGARS